MALPSPRRLPGARGDGVSCRSPESVEIWTMRSATSSRSSRAKRGGGWGRGRAGEVRAFEGAPRTRVGGGRLPSLRRDGARTGERMAPPSPRRLRESGNLSGSETGRLHRRPGAGRRGHRLGAARRAGWCVCISELVVARAGSQGEIASSASGAPGVSWDLHRRLTILKKSRGYPGRAQACVRTCVVARGLACRPACGSPGPRADLPAACAANSAAPTPLRPLRFSSLADGNFRRTERNSKAYRSDDLKFSH